MKKLENLEKLIKLWGVLDGLAIVWYIGWSISKNQMPFVYDIKHQFIDAAPQIGMGTAIGLSVFVFSAYMSLLVSGHFLFRLKKAGVVIAMIQSPLRAITVIPPSIFFLLWPLGYFFENPNAIIGFSLTVLVELIKIGSMIAWWLLSKRAGDGKAG
jgi:hypothetical protein